MYLNPERMSTPFQMRIVRWMQANGCRDYVALEPIIIRGQIIEYEALCRADKKSVARMRVTPGGDPIGRRRRLRIRIPLKDVA